MSSGSNSSVHKGATAEHITDPTIVNVVAERRRAALEDIDNAKFSWYHVRTCLVAGIGFFTDAYDLFAISIGATMIGYVYAHNATGTSPGTLTANQDLGIKVAAPVGTFCGQLLFGWLADVVGRKKMYGIELMIIIVGTFAQALSANSYAVSIVGSLVVWRFFMGLGIGGDYPLSSVITSEFAATRIRGRMMTAVFASQGWGQFAAGLVSLVIVSAYKDVIIKNYTRVDYCWRLLIGLGCVPAVVGLYFRLTIPETPRYTMDIERNVGQAVQDVDTYYATGKYEKDDTAPVVRAEAPVASRRDFIRHFSQWKNGKVLFGTAWSWFALDIAFYGLGLNSSVILGAINFGSVKPSSTIGKNMAIYRSLHNISVGNLILSVAGLIPGYWVTFLFIDSVGRKPIQIMGFVLLTIIFSSMGFGYDRMVNGGHKAAFVALYCLANFFQNFGPNTTTFIVPGEVFPTRYRSTAHGISAASGKLGAIIAQVGFSRLKDIGGTNHFIKHILEIFAFFMLTGIPSSFLIPETKGKTLEELSGEDQDGFVSGVHNPGNVDVQRIGANHTTV